MTTETFRNEANRGFLNPPQSRPSNISGEFWPMAKRRDQSGMAFFREPLQNTSGQVHLDPHPDTAGGGVINSMLYGAGAGFDNRSMKSGYNDELFSLFQGAEKNSLSRANWGGFDEVSTRSQKKKQMAEVMSRDGGSNFDGTDMIFVKKPDPADFPQNQPKLAPKPTQDTSVIETQPPVTGGLFSQPAANAGTLRKRRPAASTLDFNPSMNQTRAKKEMLDELSKPKSCPAKKTDPKRNEKGGLLGLVLLLFGNEQVLIEDLDQLNMDDKVILQSLLKRKFNIMIEYKWTNEDIVKNVNASQTAAKTKRLEENYKLVFKKALKF
jgi:hypothetical protein